ncbi:hypothetical protein KKF32_01605 [Patescibacteria group bacterium]|nr:hypothetical protein [Patescibacteria group bacterium]
MNINISQKRAQEILGKNFLSLNEVMGDSSLLLLKKEVEKIPKIPFSDKELQEKKDHILFLFSVDRRIKGQEPDLKWRLMSRKDLREVLGWCWSPSLRFPGDHTFPLRHLLLSRLRD